MEGEIEEKLLRGGELVEEGQLQGFRDRKENCAIKLWMEAKKMWVVAAPAIFTIFSIFGINFISQAFVGHVGATELAAFALVTSFLQQFANGVLMGMASGLGTLCGQAFGDARQYHMLGIYVQRLWIVLFITVIVLTPVFIFASPILRALGQDEAISELAGEIALFLVPVLFSNVVSISCQMYLQAQSKNMVISYLGAASLSIHLFLSWLLTFKLNYGLHGALASVIVGYWIPNLGQLIFIIFGGCPETWKGFTLLAFKDLWPVIKLSISSGAMICFEQWYFATLMLLAGNLKNAEVEIDALSICLNINNLEMMIAQGFLAAASVRVSNELGKGDPKAAKFSVLNIILTSLSIGIVLSVVSLFLNERLAYIFTNDKVVAAEVAHLSPILAFCIVLNSIQQVLSGVAIGAGWQSIIVYVNLASYYLLGIPLALTLGYIIKFQVAGIWMGTLIGTFVQTIILIIIILRTDWDQQVSSARKRVNRWLIEDETTEAT